MKRARQLHRQGAVCPLFRTNVEFGRHAFGTASAALDPKHKKMLLGLYSCTQRLCRSCEREIPQAKWPLDHLSNLGFVAAEVPSLTHLVRETYKKHSAETDQLRIGALVDEGFKFYRSLSYLLARIKPWASLFETTNKETVNKSVLVEKGAITIASLGRRSVDAEQILQQLDQIGDLVKARVDTTDSKSVLECINSIIYGELGFKGAEDYNKLENSFIDKVLKDRIGLPITLGIVYMAVARRVGLNLVGLNTPHRFLIYYPGGSTHPYPLAQKAKEENSIDDDQPAAETEATEDGLAPDALFVDPYSGKVLGKQEFLSLASELARRPVLPQHVEGHLRMGVMDIYARMLRNIVKIYHDKQGPDGEQTVWWSHHLSVVETW